MNKSSYFNWFPSVWQTVTDSVTVTQTVSLKPAFSWEEILQNNYTNNFFNCKQSKFLDSYQLVLLGLIVRLREKKTSRRLIGTWEGLVCFDPDQLTAGQILFAYADQVPIQNFWNSKKHCNQTVWFKLPRAVSKFLTRNAILRQNWQLSNLCNSNRPDSLENTQKTQWESFLYATRKF